MSLFVSGSSDAYNMLLMSICHCLCQVRAEICSKEEVEEEEMEAAVSSAKKFVIIILFLNSIKTLLKWFYNKTRIIATFGHSVGYRRYSH